MPDSGTNGTYSFRNVPVSQRCPGNFEGEVMSGQDLKNAVEFQVEGAESAQEREGRRHLFQPGQSGNPAGKPKGTQNRITKTIREAILESVQPGQCHPEGLVGWLRERAQGGIEDRKIFGAMVSRALPIEVTGTDGGPIKIDLGWMSQRRIGYGDVVDVIPEVTPTTQTPAKGLPSPGSTDYKSDDTDSEGGES